MNIFEIFIPEIEFIVSVEAFVKDVGDIDDIAIFVKVVIDGD